MALAYSHLSTFHLSTIPSNDKLLPPRPQLTSIRTSKGSKSSKCMAIPTPQDHTIVRRVADYHPPIWDYDYVQSLTSKYLGDSYQKRADKFKGEVRNMLNKVEDPLSKLELVDTLQRLGIYYHFEDEIKRILQSIHNDDNYSSDEENKEDLYTTSLKFRLLRQHGYDIPQEVFSTFKDESGTFKVHVPEDIKGILSFYESTFLSTRGESILDEGREFTTQNMKEYLKKIIDINKSDDVMATQVSHALEMPLHWRMLRLETRWFIDLYEKTDNKNEILLEFAKLDYNMVQAIHQKDLKYTSRWWKSTKLGEKLSFARDRLVENFFWNVGFTFEPQFEYRRRMETKLLSFITIIDDIYDIYGTLDELQLFTNAVERWDINAMEQLPDYMKTCFLSLYNTINEFAYDALKEQNVNVISILKNSWADLCNSYFIEAKWYHTGYKPSLDEYLENARISVSAPLILIHAYYFLTYPHPNVALECFEKYSSLICSTSIIVRLADDLATSQSEMKRGDTPKSIQCYMYETGASEEEAREYIRYLISETWKKMNEDRVVDKDDSLFSPIFVEMALNIARMGQCIFDHGDGFGIANRETMDRVRSLFIEPISL